MRKVSVSQYHRQYLPAYCCIFARRAWQNWHKCVYFGCCMRKGQSASATSCLELEQCNATRHWRHCVCVRNATPMRMRQKCHIHYRQDMQRPCSHGTWTTTTTATDTQRIAKDKGCGKDCGNKSLGFSGFRSLFLFTSLAALNFVIYGCAPQSFNGPLSCCFFLSLDSSLCNANTIEICRPSNDYWNRNRNWNRIWSSSIEMQFKWHPSKLG